ncbi:hypothetical protein CC85DRAFT_56539 [Cutaneotrichosporon oleaginosum]|uniref:Yeast cell wall synthesis Kre9/Knh1-like N-terminal domain-containing protein n=1 Tax=Cutaneotrichosporon oleaginosum TaxID=879819 RepID=A0A0J0XYP6_9TREE|nr:uncharacterized protein CC85DRAFT_56539 [Cutaneotrichosporon oleaginosum]KLT46175.1 hypothetical protein CC85DRAFT_56539 [Cutaneotrichosporon oleaginosum]TXT10184.1 hypothetical protein COLE_04118 [Cutaneotrichosporon oleaginosum]
MLAATLLFFAAAARAIQITSPANGTVWSAGQVQTITWDFVSTDPDRFILALQIQQPFSTQEVATVQTEAGSYSWTPSASSVGTDYRINFLNVRDNGILAQSGYFDVEQGTAVAASSSSSAVVSRSSAASRSLSASASASNSRSASASASGSALPPNVSNAPAGSGAGALVPSLALVAGSLAALLA